MLLLVKKLNLRKIQIMGDSKVAIEWVNDKVQLQVVHLQPVLQHIRYFFAGLGW